MRSEVQRPETCTGFPGQELHGLSNFQKGARKAVKQGQTEMLTPEQERKLKLGQLVHSELPMTTVITFVINFNLLLSFNIM